MGVHRGWIIGNVAHPLLLSGVRMDAGTARVPGPSVEIRGRAVIHDPAVHGPTPGPTGEEPHPSRVVLVHVLDSGPALHEVAGLRIAPGVDPVPRCGGAV